VISWYDIINTKKKVYLCKTSMILPQRMVSYFNLLNLYCEDMRNKKMIILVGGEKGGTGKTTMATNLSALRASNGKDVLLVDTDQQSSASYWCGTREENNIQPRISSVQYFGKGFISQVKDLARRYDDLVIDAGGRDSTELRDAFLIAQVAVIPLSPSQYDVWTLSRMNELVDKAVSFNTSLVSILVLNRVSSNPSVKEAEEAKEVLIDFENLNLSKAVIKDRISFRKSVPNGLAIHEQNPVDTKALAELQTLYEEVFSHVDKD